MKVMFLAHSIWSETMCVAHKYKYRHMKMQIWFHGNRQGWFTHWVIRSRECTEDDFDYLHHAIKVFTDSKRNGKNTT